MADEISTPKKRCEPTASEAMFFFAIVKHTRNKADIDWEAVAQEQNFKNADVAKVCFPYFKSLLSFFCFTLTNHHGYLIQVRFGQVKRKLGIDSTATPKKGNTSSASSTPSKVRKTPASRAGAKGRGRGGRVKKEEEGEADADAGNDTTAVESSPTKGEDHNIDLKSEAHDYDHPF